MVASLRASGSSERISALVLAALGAFFFAAAIQGLGTGSALRHPLTVVACASVVPFFCWGAIRLWQDGSKPTTLEIGSDGLSYVYRGRLSHWRWSEIDDVALVSPGKGRLFKLQLATDPASDRPGEVNIGGDWVQSNDQIWEFYLEMRSLWRPQAAPVG